MRDGNVAVLDVVRRCVARCRVCGCHDDVHAQAIGDVRASGRFLRSGFEDEQGFDSVCQAILEETVRVRAHGIWSETRDVYEPTFWLMLCGFTEFCSGNEGDGRLSESFHVWDIFLVARHVCKLAVCSCLGRQQEK
jgi:hypothetical protein